jgi:hypothetical protein
MRKLLLAGIAAAVTAVVLANPIVTGIGATGGAPEDTPEVIQTTFFFSSAGDDMNDCTQAEPCETVTHANTLTFDAGDTIYFTGGEDFDDARLTLAESGSSGNVITVTSYGIGRATLGGMALDGDYLTFNNINVDHDWATTPAIEITGNNITGTNFSAYNGEHDGVEIDGATNVLLQDGEIYHFLRGSLGSEDDAHAISCRPANGETLAVTLTGMNLHQVSGDGLQCDPDRATTATVTLTINDLECWTAPLEISRTTTSPAGQWDVGDSPGENCLDTKADGDQGSSISGTWTDVRCYGFTDIAEIPNRSCFNMKENADITFDRARVYNNEIGFRLRGAETSANCGNTPPEACGNPDVIIKNALVYDNVHGVRANTTVAVENLDIYNSTFANNTAHFTEDVAGNNAASSDLRNNAFLTSEPGDFSDSTNVVTADFVDQAGDDYRLTECATDLINQGATIGAVTTDVTGATRTGSYEIGAYDGFLAWDCPGGQPSDHSYYTDITTSPTHGTAHFNIDFRSSADIVTWDASPNTPGHSSFYDTGEDATCWEFVGTAGNYAGIANGFRGAFTAITSGRAMAYLEVKFIGDWLADIDGATQTPLRVWKDYHLKVNNTVSVDRELRYRFDLAPRSGTNVASIDLRTYGSPGTTPSGEWQIATGHFTQFLVKSGKWTRIWRYEDLDTDDMTIWIGDEDRAPVKVMDAVSFTALANWAGFTYQHITSQDTGNSGPADVSFCTRNFAIVRAIDDIADAQALVDEGDQTL